MKVVQRRADLGPRERRARSPQRLRQHAELTLPSALLRQNRLDGLWNDDFQTRVRAAILGERPGGTIWTGPCARRSFAGSVACSPRAHWRSTTSANTTRKESATSACSPC